VIQIPRPDNQVKYLAALIDKSPDVGCQKHDRRPADERARQQAVAYAAGQVLGCLSCSFLQSDEVSTSRHA
jgi:hypothetical protein